VLFVLKAAAAASFSALLSRKSRVVGTSVSPVEAQPSIEQPSPGVLLGLGPTHHHETQDAPQFCVSTKHSWQQPLPAFRVSAWLFLPFSHDLGVTESGEPTHTKYELRSRNPLLPLPQLVTHKPVRVKWAVHWV
jgi:hypothetical protein